jgi:4-hydroxybenzoate polyprenyltransferase
MMDLKWGAYARLLRLNRPIGTLLLLWPTLWALWIAAAGIPPLPILLIFVSGVLLMRSAGCVVNDYADRNIDLHVERTKARPLTTGEVSVKEAMILFALLVLVAFILVLFLNTYTILLSFGALVLAMIYPFMKRYTYLPQVVLGAAFAWAVPMAFAAIQNRVPQEAWLLYVVTVLWTTAYDTMYGMVDREDDLKIGVKSTAILFGDADKFIIGAIQALVVGGLFLLGLRIQSGPFYYMAVTLAASLFVYQQYLIRERSRDGCFKAFLNNHWFGLVVFCGLLLDNLLRIN